MKNNPARLRIPDELVKLIRNMHPLLKRKVRAGLAAIAEDYTCGKALQAELQGLISYRVGAFRIIYRTAEKNNIEVVAIGPRKNIYQETYRILREGK
jgi:mRNA interferase RelE/StbE